MPPFAASIADLSIILVISTPYILFFISALFVAFVIFVRFTISFVFSPFVLFAPFLVFTAFIFLPVTFISHTSGMSKERQVLTVKHLPMDFHCAHLGKLLSALCAANFLRGGTLVLLAVQDEPRLRVEFFSALAACMALLPLVDKCVALGVCLAGELGATVRALEGTAAGMAQDVLSASC